MQLISLSVTSIVTTAIFYLMLDDFIAGQQLVVLSRCLINIDMNVQQF
jgi:hypothetical protein